MDRLEFIEQLQERKDGLVKTREILNAKEREYYYQSKTYLWEQLKEREFKSSIEDKERESKCSIEDYHVYSFSKATVHIPDINMNSTDRIIKLGFDIVTLESEICDLKERIETHKIDSAQCLIKTILKDVEEK